MGRKLLADPELPKKLAEGREEDGRPCVYCYTCVSKIYTLEATCCATAFAGPAKRPAAGAQLTAHRGLTSKAIEETQPPKQFIGGSGPRPAKVTR
jgi:2,4-dienoyl-CoA reductase (NADPH2)